LAPELKPSINAFHLPDAHEIDGLAGERNKFSRLGDKHKMQNQVLLFFQKIKRKVECANLTAHRQAGMFSIKYATSGSLINFLESAPKTEQSIGIVLA
jgi:hypothetical protein